MRALPILAVALASCFGQTSLAQTSFAQTSFAQTNPGQTNPAPFNADDAQQLATHLLQLMESTAVAVPGLVRAAEPLKQNAEATLAALQKTQRDPALTYLFMKQVNAYLALSDSIPRPSPFPAAADRQFDELREGLRHMERQFEAGLQTLNAGAQAREADPADLKHFAEANSKLLPPGVSPRIVFLGDSITEGWRLNEYFTGRDFVNRGISGQTTMQMLARFPEDVLALHPRAVMILAGTNDLAHGANAAAIENDLSMMGDLAKAHSIKPLFASILPVNDYHKTADPGFERTINHPSALIQQINQWLKDYCQREGFIYVDYYSRMVDASGMLQNDLSDDGLHPNSRGYRVMSPIALEAIGRVSATEQNPPGEPPKRRFRMLGK